jgi:hypothetical protein
LRLAVHSLHRGGRHTACGRPLESSLAVTAADAEVTCPLCRKPNPLEPAAGELAGELARSHLRQVHARSLPTVNAVRDLLSREETRARGDDTYDVLCEGRDQP